MFKCFLKVVIKKMTICAKKLATCKNHAILSCVLVFRQCIIPTAFLDNVVFPTHF